MQVDVFANADEVVRQAARFIAAQARAAVGLRGRFVMAVSGGSTPWQMLRLAHEEVPWPQCTWRRSTNAWRRPATRFAT